MPPDPPRCWPCGNDALVPAAFAELVIRSTVHPCPSRCAGWGPADRTSRDFPPDPAPDLYRHLPSPARRPPLTPTRILPHPASTPSLLSLSLSRSRPPRAHGCRFRAEQLQPRQHPACAAPIETSPAPPHPPAAAESLGFAAVRRDMDPARPHPLSHSSTRTLFPFQSTRGGPYGPGSALESPLPPVAPITAPIPAAVN